MAKKESKNENKVKKHFFKDFKAELKKVIWPSPKQLVNNTVAVVTIVLITAVIVLALDTVYKFGNENGITKLQSIVDEKFNSEEENVQQEGQDSSTPTEGETSTDENTTIENTETPVENTAQS